MNNTQPISGTIKDIQQEHYQHVPSHERRRSSVSESPISPMPTGPERMVALRDLGATFEEGKKSVAKVATPNETVVPSFVDSNQLEYMLHHKRGADMEEVAKRSSIP
ncbi:hypothetical protein CU097_011866 [Rhizopus azygosporus]|uniref:Uncharacterized protein n=1 Tax=Rhizopus azygosporus TaxID=86630 RepID=A0A367JHS1_RHIAZ|nr:hypothetical protein CU097_011866 [Rhizopus azygosporus]